MVNGVGMQPNQHDAMTGSTEEGRAYPANLNLTCNNWASSTFGSTMLGHIDRNAQDRAESAVLERGPHVPQLQPARSDRDRRQRPVLLLRAVTVAVIEIRRTAARSPSAALYRPVCRIRPPCRAGCRAPAWARLIASTERSIADHSRAISSLQAESPLHLARARPCGERAEECRALADLARPHRHRQPLELGPRQGDCRRFLVLALDRGGIDHHRVGLVEFARGRDRLAHGGEIEKSRAHRNDHHGRGADRLLHHQPGRRRGVDEDPFVAVESAHWRRGG